MNKKGPISNYVELVLDSWYYDVLMLAEVLIKDLVQVYKANIFEE